VSAHLRAGTLELPPPSAVEAEEAVLGCILSERDAMKTVRPLLAPSFGWYIPAHQRMYAAMCALYDAGTPVDELTVMDELRRRGAVDPDGLVGGVSLFALARRVPTVLNVLSYVRIVQRTAANRALPSVGGFIAGEAFNDLDPANTIAAVRAQLDAIERDYLSAERQEGAQASPFHLLSIADILASPRPPALIEGLYSLNSTGIKFSPPGVGKTALLLDQMGHVALSRAWEGHAVHGGHVVYVCAEGQAFLPERLQALLVKLGVEDIPRLHILTVRVQLLEPRTVPGLIATCAAELPELPVWIAFDTVSQTAAGADENDANDMRDYVNALDRIRAETGAFVDAIHHTGKDGSRGARGSSVLHGNFDTVIHITEVEGVAVMKCEKQRGGWAPFKPFSYKVVSRALDEDGFRTGPVIEACDPPEKVGMPASYLKTLDALAGRPGSTAKYAVWLALSEVSESTFNRHREYLVNFEYVQHDTASGAYCLTTKGAGILPRYSHETPTGATG
jgi:hypothetical protein